jgi:tetratricopeptide (TPR) repeat protein
MVMSEEKDLQAQPHWLDWAEGASIIAAVGGSIVGTMFSNVAAVGLPISMAAALNFANRQRLRTMVTTQVVPTVELQTQQLQRHSQELVTQQEAIEKARSSAKGTSEILMIQLSELRSASEEDIRALQAEMPQLKEQLAALANTQAELLSSTPEDSYYRRGLEELGSGNYKAAVDAFTQALGINAEFAMAYTQRAKAHAFDGKKQLAIADLRVAAKIFFEAGDLENYNSARNLSEQIHANQLVPEVEAPVVTAKSVADNPEASIAVGELFV